MMTQGVKVIKSTRAGENDPFLKGHKGSRTAEQVPLTTWANFENFEFFVKF